MLEEERESGCAPLRTDRPTLVVIDGRRAPAKAVRAVYGKRALIQRCQEHKKRDVLDALPKGKRDSVRRRRTRRTSHPRSMSVRSGCWRTSPAGSRQSTRVQPASLREGLDETLTVKLLGLSDTLERALSTTNTIENPIGQVRTLSKPVARWRDGQMVLRWTAAGVL